MLVLHSRILKSLAAIFVVVSASFFVTSTAQSRDPLDIPVLDHEKNLEKRSIFGYANAWSVRPGEKLDFKVSNYQPGNYEARLVKLLHRNGVTPETAYAVEEINAPFKGTYEGKRQEIHPGSYVHIDSDGALDNIESFTVSAAIYPTLLPMGSRRAWSDFQHIISRWNEPTRTGWTLGIDDKGRLAFMVGRQDAEPSLVIIDTPLAFRKWMRIAVSYDAETGKATLRQIPAPNSPGEMFALKEMEATGTVGVVPQQGALRFGAAVGAVGNKEMAQPSGAYNGKLDKVRLVRGALSRDEIGSLAGQEELRGEISSRRFYGFWDFAQGTGTTEVHDLSRKNLHGMTVNLPGRAVTGIEWNGESVNWKEKPAHYSAIYFHEDDVYDAEWSTDFTFTVPEGLDSGVYAAHVKNSIGGEDYITFFVLAPKEGPKADVALYLTTATYLAYANSTGHLWPVGKRVQIDANGKSEIVDEWFTVIEGGDLSYKSFFDAHPEFPGGIYRRHTDGSPVRHASIHYPTFTTRPNFANAWLSADLGFIAWLEKEGVSYDIITDETMHNEGYDLLKDYRVVISAAHPEYASGNQIEAIETYLENGGRFMYLSGNGFIPVTAYHQDLPGVIEVRHLGSPFDVPDIKESYYEFDGQLGVAWETAGKPPHQLFGVGFVIPLVLNGNGYYRLTPQAADPRAEFIFDGVQGDIIGDFGKQAGGVAGVEVDAVDMFKGTPPHALVVGAMEGAVWPYDSSPLGAADERYRPFFPPPRSNIVFFETPKGGAVFAAGTMAWVGSLPHNDFDNNVAQVSNNVLKRFLDPKPFVAE